VPAVQISKSNLLLNFKPAAKSGITAPPRQLYTPIHLQKNVDKCVKKKAFNLRPACD
jgi:hypothetical protein